MDTSSEDGENDDKCDSSFTSKKELSVEEAFRLLTTDDDTVTITAVPPVRPKAGQVFLFKPDSPANGGKLNVLAKVKAFGS